ncbi:polyprenyl synthetase family protein [Micromonospora sp. NPDC051141]|uniref:polyprenyl synthetase family protein n=1 Tax=Micromonospora sp. NPDC051141 TaxID=3364284 RepID=UPI0037A9628F
MLQEFELSSYLREQQGLIDRELERALDGDIPEPLRASIRYSLMSGGKRLRPILCLAACTAHGGRPEIAFPTAVALEMLHTATLIHDDLPAMDNDDFRRGRPTNHKVFGEGVAVLTGDALLAYSLEYMLTRTDAPPERLLRVVGTLLHAIGVHGAIGGQVIDIQNTNRADVDLPTLESMDSRKTGALLVAALASGAVLADASEEIIARLCLYGEKIGLAFQIVDDILDVTSTLDELGKTPHKDDRANKATFPRLLGLEESRRRATTLVESAKQEVEILGKGAAPLFAIADYVCSRSN